MLTIAQNVQIPSVHLIQRGEDGAAVSLDKSDLGRAEDQQKRSARP